MEEDDKGCEGEGGGGGGNVFVSSGCHIQIKSRGMLLLPHGPRSHRGPQKSYAKIIKCSSCCCCCCKKKLKKRKP